MERKFHKVTFDRIPEEKRERILAASLKEFASNGFKGTNVSTIARSSGISIGAVYKYFPSKENLFMTVIDYGYQDLDRVLLEIVGHDDDIFVKIERILRAAINYSREKPQVIQVYLHCTTEGLPELAKKMSQKIETITAKYYRSLIAEASSKGIIAAGIDDGIAAFFLDSLFLIFQFSYACTYYNERMQIFTGLSADDDETMISRFMQFIKKGLGVK
jgi:TetR/AcrR family transcriptional regulator